MESVVSVKPGYGQPEKSLKGKDRVKKWAEAELAFWHPLEAIRSRLPGGVNFPWVKRRTWYGRPPSKPCSSFVRISQQQSRLNLR